MYVYEFESVKCCVSGWGAKGIRLETEGQHQIIERRAGEGWRYAGFIPTVQRGAGFLEEMELVFERELP